MKKNKNLYREKSIDKFTSTDELNHYTKANNPSLWIFLISLLCVTIGFFIWVLVGDIAIKVTGSALIENNVATVFIRASDAERVNVGQEILINGSFFTIKEKESESYKLTQDLVDENKYLAELGGFTVGEWLTVVYSDVTLSNGSFKAEITVDRVKPIKFIFN